MQAMQRLGKKNYLGQDVRRGFKHYEKDQCPGVTAQVQGVIMQTDATVREMCNTTLLCVGPHI